VVGLMLLFSSAAGKRVHYILPAVPPLCMLAGYAAEDVFLRHRWFSAGKARLIANGHAVMGVMTALGAAVAAEAASGGWISHTIAKLIKPIADKVTPAQIAEAGRYFLWPTVLMAAVLCGGAWAMRKNRGGLSFAALAISAAVLLVSLAGWPELIEEAPNAAQEVRWIKSKLPPGVQLSSWNLKGLAEPLVYYYGSDLPNAALALDKLRLREGDRKGREHWLEWMNEGGPRWLLVRRQDPKEVEEPRQDVTRLQRIGYVVVDPNHTSNDEAVDVILMRPARPITEEPAPITGNQQGDQGEDQE